MTYFQASKMTEENRARLLAWLGAEGLDPMVISGDNKFSVHNGRISGFKFIPGDNEFKRVLGWRKEDFLCVPFNIEQKHPLPEWL